MSERYWIAEGLCLDRQDARVLVDGAPVHLGARAFDLLTVLMERPQVLMTKDELFARVWAGVTVSDAVLTTAMKELRQAIGDSARQPRFVETAHGRGYRFLLPVVRTDELAASIPEVPSTTAPVHRSPWLRRALTGAACLLVLVLGALGWMQWDSGRAEASVHAKSIVVLPFEDLSPNGDQRWFADGLAAEIQATLARTPDLRIGSRLSAARLIQGGVGSQQVAIQMGAAQFLEGSVRRSGERVRVTVNLIRTADGSQIWSHTYDRDAQDIIFIQEDVAFQIASALKTVMDPERLRVMVASGTGSVDAYEAYLQGLALDQRQLETGDVSFSAAAADAYERARTLDPQFSAAHWKAARTWYGNQTRVDAGVRAEVSEAVRMARYRERVDVAIVTSRDDVERLRYESARALLDLQVRTAHRLLVRYLKARPRDLDAWEQMADVSAYAGELGWMRKSAERIHTLSVQEGDPRSRAITVSVLAMDLNAAVDRAREQLALRPDSTLTQYQAHRALVWSGKLDEARALLPAIRGSRLPVENVLLAEMRQACADRRIPEARNLRRKIDALGEMNSSWLAAQIDGDLAGATAVLRPLDTPERLTTLMQYRINPTFNSGDYPLLASRLAGGGVKIRPARAMPYACPAAGRS